ADGPLSLAFSRDGRTLVAGNSDRSVRLWNLTGERPSSGAIVKVKGGNAELQHHAVKSVAISPDGKMLAACIDGTDGVGHLWGLPGKEPKVLSTLQGDNGTEAPQAVAFAPDGKTLAWTWWSVDDNEIRLWDLSGEQPKERARAKGLKELMNSLVFAPN